MDDYTNSPSSTPSNDSVTKIRILLECTEEWYTATSIDEYGSVCRKRNSDRDRAIEKCKQETIDMLGGECEFIIEEIHSKDTRKDDDRDGGLAGAT